MLHSFLQFGQVILSLFMTASWVVAAVLSGFGCLGICVVDCLYVCTIGCLAFCLFCSILLFSGLLTIFWLLVGAVTITGALFSVLFLQIPILLSVFGNTVFSFLKIQVSKAIIVKVIAVTIATEETTL